MVAGSTIRAKGQRAALSLRWRAHGSDRCPRNGENHRSNRARSGDGIAMPTYVGRLRSSRDILRQQSVYARKRPLPWWRTSLSHHRAPRVGVRSGVRGLDLRGWEEVQRDARRRDPSFTDWIGSSATLPACRSRRVLGETAFRSVRDREESQCEGRSGRWRWTALPKATELLTRRFRDRLPMAQSCFLNRDGASR